MRSDRIDEALRAISPASATYEEWIEVGMALKQEGYPCSAWDGWSRDDDRYRPGECERKWRSFDGATPAVGGGTIIRMAMERGWGGPRPRGGPMGWDDEIGDPEEPAWAREGAARAEPEAPDAPAAQLAAYLAAMFEPDELVGYVADSWQGEDGRWRPRSGGHYDRTAGELAESLGRHPDDLAATTGDWNPEAGAWIRVNPLDGRGAGNGNVTAFRHCLAESDSLPPEQQERIFRESGLPITAMVSSGGKSVHALVRVDAGSAEEYAERAGKAYDCLESLGMPVDRQNKNPSRLSRMPGATRGGAEQRLIALGVGAASWAEWEEGAGALADGLPDAFPVTQGVVDSPPELAEELIAGVLRRGHKMLVAGPSKAGKSFLLMELCVCIAEGLEWLGHACRRARVLYVNLEIDNSSVQDRFSRIYRAMGVPASGNVDVWPLRGHAEPLDRLGPKLVRRMRRRGYGAVVIDPIYKVITGDENNATEMGAFCNEFDKICEQTGCSVVYCHHHSKGLQGFKAAQDRASGSGVFARDPDAVLDIIQLQAPEMEKERSDATAWRMEASLREFPPLPPAAFWFEPPVHRLDDTGALRGAELMESGGGRGDEERRQEERRLDRREERRRKIEAAFDACRPEEGGGRTLKDMAAILGISARTARDWVDESNEYVVKNNIVLEMARR